MQAENFRAVDVRSEIYSLGCVLYHLISGKPPFGPHTGNFGKLSILQAHRIAKVRSLSTLETDIPAPLGNIVSAMLEKSPENRPQSISEVAIALTPFVDQELLPIVSQWIPVDLPAKFESLDARTPKSSSGRVTRATWLLLFVILSIVIIALSSTSALHKKNQGSSLVVADQSEQRKMSDVFSPEVPELARGMWNLENDELIQSSLLGGWGLEPILTFGNPNWTDYDFTVEVLKLTEGSIKIYFHASGKNERCWYSPSCYDKGRGAELAQYHKGHWERAEGNFVWQTDPPEVGKWYSVKLEIRGELSRCFLGDHLQFEHRDPRFTKGRIGLGTWTAGCKFRNIRVTTPSGKVLWTGFPQIPAPKVVSDPATPDPYLAGSHPPLAESPFNAAEAEQYQAQWANHLLQPIEISNSVGLKLRLIPPGTFWIGSPQEEKDRLDDEVRSKRTLSRPFYIGRTEVTQGEWKAVMNTAPWKGRKYVQEGTNVPATHVSARDAEMFLEKLNNREADSDFMKQGWTYRLPSEAQWEYACRAGTQTRFGFGDEDSLLGEYAWYGGVYGNGNCQDQLYAHKVKMKLPNQFGLYDMHGNLGEWCRDLYAADYYENSPQLNPQGPTTGIDRSLRGGSWYYFGNYCRSAQRNGFNPFHRSYDMGFRVALMLRPPAKSISK